MSFILLVLVNPLVGVMAVIFSNKTRNANRCGQVKEARRYSRVTCCLIVLGILVTMVVLVVLGIYLANMLIDMRDKRQAAGGCDPEKCVPDTPCVKTQSGCTRGRHQKLVYKDGRHKSFHRYLGIPFAKPPINSLRFKDPVPVVAWGNEVRDAFHYGKTCWGHVDSKFPGFKGSEIWNVEGHKKNMSENCLYLNVWKPADTEDKLPVIVWIFGGGFFSGSASLAVYQGHFLATSQNVIVVSMNYRLGALGFLASGDGTIKGNFGLKDQRLALKWVHENIEKFGGDPNTVTIMGESAGSASVGYHLVNKESGKYFQKAIMQSASQLSPWAFTPPDNVKLRFDKLVTNLKCDDSDTESKVECLRSKTGRHIMENEWVISSMMFFPWSASQDGDFITDSPLKDLETRNLEKKPLLFSSNKDEGTFWIIYNFPSQFNKEKQWINITRDQLKEDFKALVKDLPNKAQKDAIFAEYANAAPSSDGVKNSKLLDLILGDRHFTCPVDRFGGKYPGSSKYYLQYYYRDSTETWPLWMGVIHGADVQWSFGVPLDGQQKYTSKEVKLAYDILKYFTNFARTGDPNGESLPVWKAYSTQNKDVLRMNQAGKFEAVKFSDEFYPRESACAKWNAIESTSTCCA